MPQSYFTVRHSHSIVIKITTTFCARVSRMTGASALIEALRLRPYTQTYKHMPQKYLLSMFDLTLSPSTSQQMRIHHICTIFCLSYFLSHCHVSGLWRFIGDISWCATEMMHINLLESLIKYTHTCTYVQKATDVNYFSNNCTQARIATTRDKANVHKIVNKLLPLYLRFVIFSNFGVIICWFGPMCDGHLCFFGHSSVAANNVVYGVLLNYFRKQLKKFLK